MPLSKSLIADVYYGRPTKNDEYLAKEEAIEALADNLANWLDAKGFHSYAQSERNNKANGYTERGYIVPDIETGPIPLSQKLIARMAGLRFIGKQFAHYKSVWLCGYTMLCANSCTCYMWDPPACLRHL